MPGWDLLGPLEDFSPDVFKGKDKDDQELCDFVLGLALAYNDMKDLRWAYSQLREHAPKSFEPTPELGQLSGLITHSLRSLYATIYEAAKLIAENDRPQNTQEFKSILSNLPKSARQHWESLKTFASGGPAKDDLMKLLTIVRDNVAFHYYRPKMLAKGFSYFFYESNDPGADKAYLSRGRTFFGSRFYFADAAAQGVTQHITKAARQQLGEKLDKIGQDTAVAFYWIVYRFIERRSGGLYRPPAQQ